VGRKECIGEDLWWGESADVVINVSAFRQQDVCVSYGREAMDWAENEICSRWLDRSDMLGGDDVVERLRCPVRED